MLQYSAVENLIREGIIDILTMNPFIDNIDDTISEAPYNKLTDETEARREYFRMAATMIHALVESHIGSHNVMQFEDFIHSSCFCAPSVERTYYSFDFPEGYLELVPNDDAPGNIVFHTYIKNLNPEEYDDYTTAVLMLYIHAYIPNVLKKKA